MSTLCKHCGKPEQLERAGSFTSYLFEHKFCQCKLQREASSVKVITCGTCGKAIGESQRSGSFTGFLFKDLRCQCRTPRPLLTAAERDRSHSNTSARMQKRNATRFAALSRNTQDETPQLQPGTVIGGMFKIISCIGEGGMGLVYAAEHLALNRQFALKILTPALVNEQTWQRFQAEAKILAALNHPTLVKVYDLGIHDKSLPYYSMDLVKGATLEDIIAGDGPQSLPTTIDIFQKVLDGLAYAHRHNIVHRDLKPANIMVSTTGGELSVKILDFGISKLMRKNLEDSQGLTVAGETFGSPYYMSPEQCAGEDVDSRSDIYSIGCTIFETLTARVPFEGDTAVETAMMHQQDVAPSMAEMTDGLQNIQINQSIEYVVARCLEKRADDRYQSAKEISIDLERIKEGKVPNAMAEWLKRPRYQEFKQRTGASKNATENVAQSTRSNASTRIILVSLVAAISFTVVAAAYLFSLERKQNVAIPAATRKPDAHFLNAEGGAKRDETENAEYVYMAVNAVGVDPLEASMETRLALSDPNYYYSHLTADKSKIVFKFPAQEIGRIGISSQLGESKPAMGTMIFNVGDHIRFFTSSATIENPGLISRFKPDDLNGFVVQKHFRKQNFADGLTRIAKLSGLRALEVGNTTFGDEHVHFLNELPRLRTVNLNNTLISARGVKQMTCLKKLNNIYYNINNDTKEFVRALSGSRALQVLHVSGIDRLIDKNDLTLLMQCPNLHTLRAETESLNLDFVQKLAALPKMRSLTLSSGTVTAAMTKQLETQYKRKGLQIIIKDPATSVSLELSHREKDSGWFPAE